MDSGAEYLSGDTRARLHPDPRLRRCSTSCLGIGQEVSTALAQILIIASDPREDALLRSRLADWDGRLLTVESGARGVAEARAGATDLVLLSHALGAGLEALEVCRRLK